MLTGSDRSLFKYSGFTELELIALEESKSRNDATSQEWQEVRNDRMRWRNEQLDAGLTNEQIDRVIDLFEQQAAGHPDPFRFLRADYFAPNKASVLYQEALEKRKREIERGLARAIRQVKRS